MIGKRHRLGALWGLALGSWAGAAVPWLLDVHGDDLVAIWVIVTTGLALAYTLWVIFGRWFGESRE